MSDSLNTSMDKMSINTSDGPKKASNSIVNSLYNEPSSASVTEIKRIFTSPTPEELETLTLKLQNDVTTTLNLIETLGETKPLIQKLSKSLSLSYLTHLRSSLKTSSSPKFYLQLIDSFINNFQYSLDELTPIISSITTFIEHEIVVMTLIKFYALYQEKSFVVLEEQLEILTLQEDFIPSFKLMALMFQLNSKDSIDVFGMNSLQFLLAQVGPNKSDAVIKEGLQLLSVACVDDGLRKQISMKYLDLLISGAQSTQEEIRVLASLVIVKTWNFSSLEAKQSLTLDDLLDIFLEKLTTHSIEALAYLSIKTSVKVRLRHDETFVFDLTKLLEDPPIDSSYGILVLLANLTSIEEKSEINDLKKQANKGLDDGVEESEEEIEEFIQDLVERKVVSMICSLSKMSKTSMNQVIIILYNLSKNKVNHSEVIKQGGLLRILDYLGREDETTETKMLAFRVLSTLLITSNPQLVFNTYSPNSAVNFLFQFLSLPDATLKDQFQSLLSLTNLSVMDNGRLSDGQWDAIDGLLTQEDTLLRRATLELISNLMQTPSNLQDMFDPQSAKANKRFKLVVKMMRLDDLKSQCSAVAAFSVASGFPFIASELIKDKELVSQLISLVNDQPEEGDLMERALFVVYNLIFHTERAEEFKGLQSGSLEVLKRNQNNDAKEMAKEIIQMIN